LSKLLLLLLSLLSAVLVDKAHAAENDSPASATTSIAQLPPPPGPMPPLFVDVYAYEATLHARLRDVTVREAGLTQLGTPPSRRRLRRAGWLATGVGMTVGLLCFAIAMDTIEERPFRALVVTGLIGGIVGVTGVVLLLSAPRNPYRHEIRDLHREGARVEGELRRLKWERMLPRLGVSLRGVSLTARF